MSIGAGASGPHGAARCGRGGTAVANPAATLEKGKGMRLAELLASRGVDVLYTREDFSGKGPEYVLADADIETRRTERATLRELVEGEDQPPWDSSARSSRSSAQGAGGDFPR